MSKTVSVCLLIFLIISCNSNSLSIEGFDSADWESFGNNCLPRLEQAQLLVEKRELLIGQSQEDLRKLLGTPDRHEIYKRSEKFIVYYIEPGQSCSEGEVDSLRSYLSIRFTSLGPAKEVLIHKF